MIGVYQIKNTLTNKVYIGSSKNVEFRWKRHRETLNKGIHHCCYLQRSWIKHGEATFEFSLLETTTLESLLVREQYWLEFYHAADPTYGYNTCPKAGSNLGTKNRPETIEKRRSKLIGKKFTPEHRAAISAARKKYKMPREHIEKMQAGNRVWVRDETYRKHLSEAKKGMSFSEETRRRMSEAKRGKRRTEEEKQKLSAALKGRPKPPGFGAKISVARKKAIAAQSLSSTNQVECSPLS